MDHRGLDRSESNYGQDSRDRDAARNAIGISSAGIYRRNNKKERAEFTSVNRPRQTATNPQQQNPPGNRLFLARLSNRRSEVVDVVFRTTLLLPFA